MPSIAGVQDQVWPSAFEEANDRLGRPTFPLAGYVGIGHDA